MVQTLSEPLQNIAAEKKRLRSELAIRRNLSFDENQPSVSLGLIPQQPWFQKAKTVAIYISQAFEFSTRPLFDLCIAQNKEVYVPVMHGRDLVFQRIINWKNVVPNEKNISQPMFGHEISPDKIDVFFVPLVAFDRSGNRLGRGVGYYDRLFSNLNIRGVKVGVGYEFQEFFSVPTEAHDVPMEYILTEKQIIRTL